MSSITTWNPAHPSDSSNASLLDDALRDFQAIFATAIGSSLSWPGSGGATALVGPRLGTLRFAESASNRTGGYPDGFLSIDTHFHSLRHIGSTFTHSLAGPNMLEYGTSPTEDSNWVVQEGSFQAGPTENFHEQTVTFSVAYGAAPPYVELIGSSVSFVSAISEVNAATFLSVHSTLVAGSQTMTVYWRSEGTRIS